MLETILFSYSDDFIMRLCTGEQQAKFWKIRIFKLITAYSFFHLKYLRIINVPYIMAAIAIIFIVFIEDQYKWK